MVCITNNEARLIYFALLNSVWRDIELHSQHFSKNMVADKNAKLSLMGSLTNSAGVPNFKSHEREIEQLLIDSKTIYL